ncbi:MAG: methylated-DNA--[protein]-cysteine S-methyltransferase [Desulfuromonadales bacterium]|nr:methylated-DNA--[protein]-cysteine S-methyltransferase [Desulfuromonadales bacterium]
MANDDYQRIARAIRFLEQHTLDQPSLDAVAEHIGLSPFHFQRLFRRWAGVSPKRFLQFLTAEHAKRLLSDSASVLATSLEVGLSGPGRLHDLMVKVEAVTPGEFKAGGDGLIIRYGLHETPFGDCLMGVTGRGICHLAFIDDGLVDEAVRELKEGWPKATLVEDAAASRPAVEQIFGERRRDGAEPLALLLRGTNFQLKVWQALLKIPEGALVSYRHLAEQLGTPTASRAVGNAVGRNPIAYLIPCHRVLRGNGELGGYRWGTERKKALLGCELARIEGEE